MILPLSVCLVSKPPQQFLPYWGAAFALADHDMAAFLGSSLGVNHAVIRSTRPRPECTTTRLPCSILPAAGCRAGLGANRLRQEFVVLLVPPSQPLTPLLYTIPRGIQLYYLSILSNTITQTPDQLPAFQTGGWLFDVFDLSLAEDQSVF